MAIVYPYRPLISVFVLLLMVLQGCADKKKTADEQLRHVDSVMVILTEVQKNLSRIQQKEAVVERLSTDIEKRRQKTPGQVGKDIYTSIRFIDSTLAASRDLIARLEKENRDSAYRLRSVDRLAVELRGAVDEKDREIRELKAEVQRLDTRVSELLETVDVLDEFILEQEDDRSFAYYIAGTYDDLRKKGILAKTGNPLVGIFDRGYRLAPDFDLGDFKRIDIYETKDLFFEKPAENLRIVTPHSTGSYEVVSGKNSALLLISDQPEFWKKSRCLVIVTDD
ncbi:hypothetical protein CHL67_06375 [Prosthecochloris sp. GSB1]|uniref:Cbp1 family collagen-binding glycoprotein adhesin n=1 Tax=Prosthecochloris sp. GSB1 TaxID=281093 RepID=UPI000B8CDF4C|nr:BLOC-1 subunit 2 family protein [Prosthecochloris sp. GSB1]ASQ90597.1 hypothetical protein CHL67_06375 [Prosthecochloris sp. GSB1]